MEVITKEIRYKSKTDEFRFYPLGDMHLGSIECAEPELAKKVKEISLDLHGYVLGHGDYAECITQRDMRWDTRNIAPWVVRDNILESQRRRVTNLLEPLAKNQQIIGLLSGNHEETIHKHFDTDMTRNLCHDLHVPYAGFQCFVLLKFIKNEKCVNTYVWHAWHGAGSSQTEGARLMRLTRLVSDIEADIYTMGHIHGSITSHTPDRLSLNVRTGKIEARNVVATLSGSWVKTYMQSTADTSLNPFYAEVAGYKPARIGCPTIMIKPYTGGITLTS